MSLFDNVKTAADVQKEQERVKGKRTPPLSSDIYNLIIKHAYARKSKGGAIGVNLVFNVVGEDRELRDQQWITSGDSKGNKTFYETEQDGKKVKKFLPGFIMIDELSRLTLGKGILACATEKKVIPLYSRDANAEVPTEVDMFTELLGKAVCAAVLQTLQDRTKKNDQTGKYEPTGQTFESNEVNKYFNATDRKTAIEVEANIDADYHKAWLDKWKGQVDDQSTATESTGTAGAPAGSAAPKTSLFG